MGDDELLVTKSFKYLESILQKDEGVERGLT